MEILHDESELNEIVKLVGMDALSASDRLKMETARSIREDFLHQLAFHDIDTYTSLKKQLYMIRLILEYYDESLAAAEKGADVETLWGLAVREKIGRFKYIHEDNIDAEFEKISRELVAEIHAAEETREEY
jgi:V/A-type H+-transporting ATPase subunit A